MEQIDFKKKLTFTKHFRNTWLRKWNCDIIELRKACINAKKIEKIGKKGKYEVYIILKGRKCKLIINTNFDNEIFIITGAEGN